MWQRLRYRPTADEMAAEFVSRYSAQSDAEFLAACGLADVPSAASVALAVRRSVARYGMVNADHIHHDHSYPGALLQLSGWDSLDFFAWMIELERELGALPQWSWFDSLPRPYSVRDLVEAVHAHWQ